MQQNIKIVSTIIYEYEDINAYAFNDYNTEQILSVYCANTNKLYSREVSLDVEYNSFFVEYLIFTL